MKKIILSFLASIGFLTLLGCIGFYFMISTLLKTTSEEEEKISHNTVLNLKVGRLPFADVTTNSDIISLVTSGRSPSLFETVSALKQAAEDSRIKGVFLNIEGASITLAQAQELREALTLFREAKKPIYAFAYSFGEGTGGTTPYYLATIADKIFMQPQGSVELTGYAIDSYFVRDLLDKYKVKPQLDRREGYKGIIETYTNNDFSPETKQNLSSLLGNMLDQVSETITTKLNLQHNDIKELIDAAPFIDTIAADKKLINQLLHKDEVEKLFDTNPDVKPTFASIKTYRRNAPTHKTAHSFALISVSDEITTPTPASYNQESNSPEKVVKSLQKAANDSSISAIILRVDSPGGTVTGAEAIWYEVNRIANTLKKPIIVSMGTLAASAGYQIAAPATKIVANPGTITGSIGVATGKLSIKEAAAEFGINLRQIKTAKHAGMWSMAEEFSPEEWANMQKDLDHYYDIFLKKVADGRHLSLDKTRAIAKGQVWTGKQAKEIGLVDELGGFLKAFSVAKQLLNIPEESYVEIVMMEESSLIGSFFDDFFGGVELISNLNQQVRTVLQGQTAVESKLGFIPH